MVDPTKSIGTVIGFQATDRSQVTKAPRNEETQKTGRAQDEVSLSPEALSLTQAQEAAAVVRRELQDKPDVSLGIDPQFVDQRA
jgi:hypothetical protein